MPTAITISRTSAATSIGTLQADTELFDVGSELETYLETTDIRTVTRDDLVDLLEGSHTVAADTPQTHYYLWLNPDTHLIERVCVTQSVISINDDPQKEAIEVTFQMRASYD